MSSPYVEATQARSRDIRPMLLKLAAHFTSDPDVCNQIVEAAIFNVIEDPYLIESDDVRQSLYNAVARTARDTIGINDWRSGPLDVEVYSEGERFVVRLSNGSKSEKMRFIRERFALAYAKTLKSRTLVVRK